MEFVTTGVGPRIGIVLATGLALLIVERFVPIYSGVSWRSRLWPNLATWGITLLTFGLLNFFLSQQLLATFQGGLNLFGLLGLPTWAVWVAGFVLLDLAIYLGHLLMHKIPWFWRAHQVHHSDTMVDVTTALRQHPFESLIRYSCQIIPAIILGLPPELVAIYALVNGAWAPFEHCNIAIPERLNRWLVKVILTPNMHKIHHSDHQPITDSNYGNLLSVWDRMFGTYAAPIPWHELSYGLEDKSPKGLADLLLSPFRYLDPFREK